jgi:DNA-directed RNA polymerase specialized sigma24 family protein
MALVHDGVADEEIAKQLGLAPETVRKYRRRGGVVRKAGRYPDEMRNAVRARAEEGWPTAEIMAEFNVSREYIASVAPELTGPNGKAWRRVIMQAQRAHPDLFDEIQRMKI